MEKFESFFNKFVMFALFAGIGTPIYLLIMDSWKSALLLFVAYNIVFMLNGFGVVLTKLKQTNIDFFILSAIFLIIVIVPHIILVVIVCAFLWDSFDGMFMGIFFISNICYGIIMALISFAFVGMARDDIKRKQAELAEVKKREQQEIIETAVRNALKDYKNKE